MLSRPPSASKRGREEQCTPTTGSLTKGNLPPSSSQRPSKTIPDTQTSPPTATQTQTTPTKRTPKPRRPSTIATDPAAKPLLTSTALSSLIAAPTLLAYHRHDLATRRRIWADSRERATKRIAALDAERAELVAKLAAEEQLEMEFVREAEGRIGKLGGVERGSEGDDEGGSGRVRGGGGEGED